MTRRTNRRRIDSRARAVLATAAALAVLALQLILLPTASATPTSSPPGPAKPATRATFGIGPARVAKEKLRRPYFNYVATPNAHLTDHVVVTNYSLSPLTLTVYATDAYTAPNGNFSLLGQGVQPKDAGSWISLNRLSGTGAVTIRARSSLSLPMRVTIPANASPGDHAAGIVASLTTVSKDNKGANVRLIQRIGARVFIRVSGPLHPKLSIERLSAHYVNNWNPFGTGSAVVSYRVRNTGNVKLGAQQRVSIRGLFGTTARISPSAVPLLLPGGHIDVRARVTGVVPEIWTSASVRLTPITFPGDADTGLSDWSATTHFWAVPWVLLGVLILAISGAGWWWWRRRRARRAATPPTEDAPRREPARSRS